MPLIKCIDCEKQFSDRAFECPNCGLPTEEILYETDENYRNSMDEAEEAYESVDSVYNLITLIGLICGLGVGMLMVIKPDMDSVAARVILFAGAIAMGVAQILKKIEENKFLDKQAVAESEATNKSKNTDKLDG